MDQETVFALCACLALIRIALDNEGIPFKALSIAVFGACAGAAFETGKALTDLIDLRQLGLSAYWARALEHYTPPFLAACIGWALVPANRQDDSRTPQ